MSARRIASVTTEILADPANPMLLIHVTDESGLGGTGETWWGHYRPDLAPGAPVAPIASMIDAILGPTCVGSTLDRVSDIETIWHELIRATYQYGDEGIVRTAISGLDIALWDLLALGREVPVAALLGPILHDRVPVYASLDWLPDAEAIVVDAVRALDAGFGGVKLHESRAEVILAVRDQLGPDVTLMVDASAAYDEPGSVQLASALAPADLTWLEEPLFPQRDHQALARIRAQASMPFAAGENEFSAAGFEQLIGSGAVNIVQPEIAKFGGLTPARQIGELITSADLGLSPHNYSMGPSWLASWHWACTEPSTAWLEVPWLSEGAGFPLNMAMPTTSDGTVAAPIAAGLGIRDTLCR